MNTLRLLIANKHTSAAGVIYLVAKFGSQLGGVWFPAHKAQFDSTANIVEGAAVFYGLIAAGDATQSQQPGTVIGPSAGQEPAPPVGQSPIAPGPGTGKVQP